ncbi:Transcription factor 23 [Pteropus alecto]|uniref:Transcription factor 23 n=1 Tax=Pteropus alecto TaxID=9402 RepID=L5JSH8_PTEAL|nr:Transcription factor 23 [Pteropus alecto]
MTLLPQRPRLRQGSDPAPAPQVRADSAALLWCPDTQLRSYRRLSSGAPAEKALPAGAGRGRLFHLDQNGVTRAVLATQTRLEAPSPLAQRSRALDGRSRKGKAGTPPLLGPLRSPGIRTPKSPHTREANESSRSDLLSENAPSHVGRSGWRSGAATGLQLPSRVQTLRHAFLELQRTLPSVPPDTKLSKLDVLLLATTYIAHLTRSLQDDAEAPADPGLGALRGDGYLHPVKKWPMRSRLYIGATGQFLKHSISGEKANHGSAPADSQP